MKVYSCDYCEPVTGPCLLVVTDDGYPPEVCPYNEKTGAGWVRRCLE